MARGGPSTGGSKGGGNVVPTNQPTMGGRFGTLGGPGYGPNPLGSAGPRGIVAGDYTYGKGLPRRFPSQQPRYPMPRNPYSQPPSRYGRMQGPTGLGGFLSNQPAISQRQIDPATGFPVQTGSGKGGSKGGAKTVRSPDQGRETNRQPQPDIGMDPYGTQSFKIDPDILDRGTVMNPVYRSPAGQDAPQAREGQLARFPGLTAPPSPTFGNNPPPSPVRQYTGSPPPMMDAGQYLRTGRLQTQGPERSMGRFQSQGPESLMRMGKAPNIRPAMNVGKATGGPVGLASLIGRY